MEATDNVHRGSEHLWSSRRLGFPVLPPDTRPSILLGHSLGEGLHITGWRVKQGGQRTLQSPKEGCTVSLSLKALLYHGAHPARCPRQRSVHRTIRWLHTSSFRLHVASQCCVHARPSTGAGPVLPYPISSCLDIPWHVAGV